MSEPIEVIMHPEDALSNPSTEVTIVSPAPSRPVEVVLDNSVVQPDSTDNFVEDSIANGVTGVAPSQNAVYDALAGKSDVGHDHDSDYAPLSHNHNGDYEPAGTAASLVEDQIVDGVTGKAPSQDSVHDALAGKADADHTHDDLYQPVGEYATASQGSLAETAVQPDDLPVFGDIVTHNSSEYATANHGHSGEYEPVGAAALLVEDQIVDGRTNKAPSQNVVHDALAGKSDTSHTHDGAYSPVDHNHDATYAPLVHTHSGIPSPASDSPLVGAAAAVVGTSTKYAREDHVHPITPSRPFRFRVNDYWCLNSGLGVGYTTTSPSTTTSNSNNQVIYMPFYVPSRIGINSIALGVGSANTGPSAVLRLGIYSDSDGLPGMVVVDAGTASLAPNGMKEMVFTEVFLDPGWYFAAMAAQNLDTAGTNPTFGCLSTTTTTKATTAINGNNNMTSYYTLSVSGAFSNNPTIGQIATNPGKFYNIWVRVSTP